MVCALGATLYADVPKAFSSGRGAIFERVRWTMKRECCVAVVKNFKGKSGTTAEIFGYHKRARRWQAVRLDGRVVIKHKLNINKMPVTITGILNI